MIPESKRPGSLALIIASNICLYVSDKIWPLVSGRLDPVGCSHSNKVSTGRPGMQGFHDLLSFFLF